MEKILVILLLLFTTLTGFASVPDKAAKSKEETNPQIMLYEKPDKASPVINKLSPDATLVPFYHEKEWIKVGLPQDGQVGWINLQEYRQAHADFYQPNIQTVFIQMDKNTEDGKPTVNILAYKNGNKLSDSEAQVLYKKLQAENDRQRRNYWNNMVQFDQQMQQNIRNIQRFFDDSWSNMQVFALPEVMLVDQFNRSSSLPTKDSK